MLDEYEAMRALGHTKRGRELFDLYGYINYPGIANRPCPMYELREEHRERADG